MQISALSLDSQLVILSQLSSKTLLSVVPLVCARWNQLQPYACRRRRTVQLTICPNSQQSAESHHFELRPVPLNTPCAVALRATFPSVTHLMLVHRDLGFEALDPQLFLLQSWIPTLVSIDLFTNVNIQADQQRRLSPQFGAFFERFLALLNQMPRLKSLILIITGQVPPSADFSFLGRLADVDLKFASFEHILIPQLLRHCSPTLQRLSLGIICHFPDFLPLLTSSSICSKIEDLGISDFDLTQLAITFDRCSRLQRLFLYLANLVEYAERIPLLNKLPCLTKLFLDINLSIAPLDPVVASAPLPALPSVCQLTLILVTIPSHEHFAQAT